MAELAGNTLHSLIVIMPDYQGKAYRGAKGCAHYFDRLKTVAAHNPDFTWMPVLNGSPRAALEQYAAEPPPYPMKTEAFVSDARNLVQALLAGYHRAVDHSPPPQVIARMDVADHPPELLQRALPLVLQNDTVVVFDLSFEAGMLSAEEEAAQALCYRTLHEATKGKLSVGLSHSFQVFPAGLLPSVLHGAQELIREAEKARPPLCWGVDLAMLLSAIRLGASVEIAKTPAELPRHRSPAKVAAQTEALLSLLKAEERLVRA